MNDCKMLEYPLEAFKSDDSLFLNLFYYFLIGDLFYL